MKTLHLLRNKIAHSIGLGIDLLYPARCGGCGAAGRGWWCPECAAQALPPAGGVVRETALPGGQILLEVAWARFAPPVREGIHSLKFEGMPQMSGPFGELMAATWRATALDWAPDVVVPVPLHKVRQRERGYNQSERLARAVAARLNLPVDPRALVRARQTAQQAQLDRDARLKNVKDAFRAEARAAGKRILLIDDVFTTGATLSECASALYAAGAAAVAALTAARA